MLATRIKMKPGCDASTRLEDIQSVYVTGGIRPGYFDTAVLWDYLDYNPGYIQVNVRGFPNLTAAGQGEGRHLKSISSPRGIDYLFSLPQE